MEYSACQSASALRQSSAWPLRNALAVRLRKLAMRSCARVGIAVRMGATNDLPCSGYGWQKASQGPLKSPGICNYAQATFDQSPAKPATRPRYLWEDSRRTRKLSPMTPDGVTIYA